MRPVLPALAGLALLLAGCTTPAAPGAAQHASAAPLFRELCALSNWGNGTGEACSIRASFNDSPSKAEIDLAVNPKDPLNVVVGSKDLDRKASRCVWAVPQVTFDGGKTWATRYIGGDMAARQADPTNPLFLWDCVTDPIMVFDGQGVLYYALQAYNTGGNGAACPQESVTKVVNSVSPVGNPARGCGSAFYLATSADGGKTFPNDRIILLALGDGGAVFHDYPRMMVNPRTGTVSTVWNAITTAGANAYVVSTRDQGRTASPPTVVSSPDSSTTTIFASGFAADKEGTGYMTVDLVPTRDLATGTGTGGPRTVFLATSTDDAQTFGGFTKMFDVTDIKCPLPNSKFRCGTGVELAVDLGSGPYADRIYAAWDDGRHNNSDIMVSWSADHGRSWSPAVQVNHDNGTSDQWMPRVAVGLDGTVHVLYMDRSYDPGNKRYGATHAWSTDGGQHWQQQALTTALSDGDLGVHQDGFPFIGDYVGIGVAGQQGGHVYMGWPETVTGKAEVAVAHVVKQAAEGQAS